MREVITASGRSDAAGAGQNGKVLCQESKTIVPAKPLIPLLYPLINLSMPDKSFKPLLPVCQDSSIGSRISQFNNF
jgi:hypothetical protein